MANAYNTFICYRGTIDGNYSQNVAGQIYNLIKDDNRFAPVFYAPEAGNYDFIEIDNIIEKCRRFVVVLCPSFFDDFLGMDGKPDYKESSAYREMLAAFRKECEFVPVYDGQLFSMKSISEKVNRIFSQEEGINTNLLLHKTGVALKTKEFTAENVPGLLSPEGLYQEGEIATWLNQWKQYIGYIGNTVISESVHLSQEKVVSVSKGDSYVNKAINMLYDVVYVSNNNKLQLNTDQEFVTWSVEMERGKEKPVNEPEDSISVCATCFGALLWYGWQKRDVELIDRKPNGQDIKTQKRIYENAIDLLIYLRDPVSGSWMSSWENNRFVLGTINQTSLCLSTLFSCDFLNNAIDKVIENPKKANKDMLLERFQFIRKSIDWLKENKITIEYVTGNLSGWGYMGGNRNPRLLPTTFCLDVFLKYESALVSMQKIPKIEKMIPDISKEIFSVHRILEEILFYYENELDEIREKEYVYAALISKSLSTYLQQFPENQTAGRLNKYCVDILLNYPVDKIWTLDKNTYYFEVFKPDAANNQKIDMDDDFIYAINQGENYEVCAEMIFADALIKNANSFRNNGDKEKEFRAAEKAFEILKQFSEKKVELSHSCLIAQGKRESFPKYPIYLLYYYHMALYDFLKYSDD